jgi:hypothetical protein
MPYSARWTDLDLEQLRKMRKAGASPARVSVALKKSQASVKAKARELGIAFEALYVAKKRRADKEAAARAAAGLPSISKSLKTS